MSRDGHKPALTCRLSFLIAPHLSIIHLLIKLPDFHNITANCSHRQLLNIQGFSGWEGRDLVPNHSRREWKSPTSSCLTDREVKQYLINLQYAVFLKS